MHQSLMPFQ